jgi:serine/threonine protein kinase
MKYAFGCLASAVAFLHAPEIAIKHKDIKPANVLMFQGTPMLTDFALSTTFKGQENSFSSGTTGLSRLYAAPEVVSMELRNTSQDISLWVLSFKISSGPFTGALMGTPQIHAVTIGNIHTKEANLCPKSVNSLQSFPN